MSTEHDYVCGQDASREPALPDLGCAPEVASAYRAGLAIGRRQVCRDFMKAIDAASLALMLEATQVTRACAKAIASLRAEVAKMEKEARP